MRKNRNRTELRYNCNGIPINRRISLALLRVMGVDDPFEGRRYDPQFEDALLEKNIATELRRLCP